MATYLEAKGGRGPKENKSATPQTESKTSDLSDLTVAELAALAAEREVEVTGTGKDGNVLKADYVKALG
jgi:hypothetical protein